MDREVPGRAACRRQRRGKRGAAGLAPSTRNAAADEGWQCRSRGAARPAPRALSACTKDDTFLSRSARPPRSTTPARPAFGRFAVSPRPRPTSRAARSAPPRPARKPRAEPSATPWTAGLRPWHVALALAVLHLVLLLLSIIPAPHEGGDNAAYVALARSIQANGTYRE